MADISFLASERRLVVSGRCVTSDSDTILDAIEVFAGLADPLVVDFTGVTGLPREVAMSVIEACRNAERVGHLVAIQAVEDKGVLQLPKPDRAPLGGRPATERG
jgi:hypothetical protein